MKFYSRGFGLSGKESLSTAAELFREKSIYHLPFTVYHSPVWSNYSHSFSNTCATSAT
jgi:hypothetical protein